MDPSKPEFLIKTPGTSNVRYSHHYFKKICIINVKRRWERIAEILISALTQQNHLWAWSSPTWMFWQPRWEHAVSPPPSSWVRALILVFLHPILPIFPLPEIKRGGKNSKINHKGPERRLWWVLTLGQFAVVGLGKTSHHVSISHVQDCSLYKILHISWNFLKAGSWDIR